MKTAITIRTIALTALALICNFMYSGNMEPDSMCLRLVGKISKTSHSAGHSYTVQLIDNSKVIATQVVKAGKNFKFDVNKNGWYGVQIKNEECVSKLISVSTHVPNLEEGDAYLVSFEMEEPISLEESKYLDSDAIDFPLALISYEKDMDNFNYSEEYTKNIKNKLVTPLMDDTNETASKESVTSADHSNGQADLKNRKPIIK
jgi:hypothetical protein